MAEIGSQTARYFLPITFGVIFVGLVVFFLMDLRRQARAARRRGEAIWNISRELGLEFQMRQDIELPRHYFFVGQLSKGSSRRATNRLSGIYAGHQICVFDHHYETESIDGGDPVHHDVSVFILRVETSDGPAEFPGLIICRQPRTETLSQALGLEDIHFESLEFTRKFHVRSKDKKFAYDICHPRMMEYLLANPDITLEYNLYTITLTFGFRLSPHQIQSNLDRLLAVRSFVPDYLLTSN